MNPEEDIPGCSLTTFAALPGCDFQGFKSGLRRRFAPLARLLAAQNHGLAGTERTPKAFAKVGESTND